MPVDKLWRWIYDEFLINFWLNLGDEVMSTEVILRLLTFHGVVFIPNYSKLSWIPFSPFLWPKAARDAHFEQTSALFRWEGGILKYFSLLNSESYAGPTWKHLDRLGGKFLGGESSIDQMKQILGIRGILLQLKLVAFWETQSLKQRSPRSEWCINQGFVIGWRWRRSIIKAFVLFSCISPHFLRDILYFGSAPITLFCWQNKRKRALAAASNKGPQRQSDSVKNLTTDPIICAFKALLCRQVQCKVLSTTVQQQQWSVILSALLCTTVKQQEQQCICECDERSEVGSGQLNSRCHLSRDTWPWQRWSRWG